MCGTILISYVDRPEGSTRVSSISCTTPVHTRVSRWAHATPLTIRNRAGLPTMDSRSMSSFGERASRATLNRPDSDSLIENLRTERVLSPDAKDSSTMAMTVVSGPEDRALPGAPRQRNHLPRGRIFRAALSASSPAGSVLPVGVHAGVAGAHDVGHRDILRVVVVVIPPIRRDRARAVPDVEVQFVVHAGGRKAELLD